MSLRLQMQERQTENYFFSKKKQKKLLLINFFPNMATTFQQTDLLFTHEQLKLESLQLVWLDDHDNDKQATIINTFPELRKVFYSINYFTSAMQCREYIENNTINTLLVSSAILADAVLSQVHDFTHIESAYIYSKTFENEKHSFQELSIKYKKVS